MKKNAGSICTVRAAFTLLEVNLAIFIMAVGVLTMTSLYPLGFRESQQARDDVEAAIVADEVLGKLTAALSSRNIEWKDWRDGIDKAIRTSNEDGVRKGWFAYINDRGDDKDGMKVYVVRKDATDHAREVLGALEAVCGNVNVNLPSKYTCGLVVQWGKRVVATGKDESDAQDDYSRVAISFRMSRRPNALIASPIYYTEVHFQGDQGENSGKGGM